MTKVTAQPRRKKIHTEEEELFQIGKQKLAATRFLATPDKLPEIISFHGTGATANRGRIRYLLNHLADHGFSSLCFDFCGHGQSTGTMEQATLSVRKQEAQAATALLNPQVPPVLIGTSMGAFIAALLAPLVQPRSLIFFCPAAYPASAMDLGFDENFAAVARKPGAYENSPAFHALASYRGNLLIVAAGKDTIVPKEVIRLYEESAPLAKSRKTIWMEESDHKIHSWLVDRKAEKALVLREVLTAI
jgi:alpha-beta hydrolase superfamily lysophospholipase